MFVCDPAATITGPARKQYTRLTSAFAKIAADEGYRGFFRGYSTAAVIIPLFWGIYFPTYNMFKVCTMIVCRTCWPPRCLKRMLCLAARCLVPPSAVLVSMCICSEKAHKVECDWT